LQNTGFKIVINIVLTFLTSTLLCAQVPDSISSGEREIFPGEDSVVVAADSSFQQDVTGQQTNDLIPLQDTIQNTGRPDDYRSEFSDDTVISSLDTLTTSDTTQQSELGSAISDEVDYDAIDSLNFSMDGGTVEMYNQAIVTYGDIKLEAGYIKYEMHESEVIATGIPDSTGKIVQNPVFSEGEDSYEAKYIRYNFKTKRGFIEEVITEEEGGYLHSHDTKIQKNGHIHMKDGKYTTCDAEHPHFYVAITKGISMPGDKIVAGPAYLVVEDVPLPIGLPFGFFPNSRKKTSGLLIPQYGEEQNRGFFLRDGGYYFALNDYMDFRMTGDIYSNGTWGVRVGSNYLVRYKFNGSLNMQFFNNVNGFRNIEGSSTSRDYSIGWSHGQAREANPNSSFRASVNLSSSSYDQLHTRNINSVVRNTKQSSISYTKSWPNSPFNLSASLNHSQNNQSGAVNLTLPNVNFNMGRINPFERKQGIGPKKWYEDIQLRYSSRLENRIRTGDSTLFTNQVWSDMRNGFRHEIPLSLNIKPFKKIAALQSMTITPNVSYSGMVYTSQKEKSIIGYAEEEVDGVVQYTPIVQDTTYQGRLSYAHSYLPRVSAGLSPKLYGMYNFTGDGRLKAIRHVMTTSASVSYVPDMTGIQPDYYRDLYDTVNNTLLETYSIYEGQIYGTPTFNGASGSMSLSLRNNLEAKMASRNDTIDELQKVKLLDNFNFSTSYNFFNRDTISPSWSPISMNGNTRLFNNKLSVSFRGVVDPFGYSDTRSRVRETYYSQTGKFLRMTQASITMGTSFSSQSNEKKEDNEPQEEIDPLTESAFDNTGINDPNRAYDPSMDDAYGDYVDFDVPWSLRLDYSFSYRKQKDVSSIVQTLRMSGDLSLTPKWKIGFNSGYDIFNKEFTTTNLSLYRDLHCWEMRISVVPFGRYKSYNFTINAKSTILSDLKYNKRKSWQDNF